MTIGQQVKFRNGEIVTIKNIINNRGGFITCMHGKSFEVQPSVTFVLEFDDGEITIGNQNEIEVL